MLKTIQVKHLDTNFMERGIIMKCADDLEIACAQKSSDPCSDISCFYNAGCGWNGLKGICDVQQQQTSILYIF